MTTDQCICITHTAKYRCRHYDHGTGGCDKNNSMERNTIASINELQPGDRFYKQSDKKKEVFVKVEHNQKRTYFRTYRNFCVLASIYDAQKGKVPELWIKPMTATVLVVFLRHQNSINVTDELTGKV